MAILLTIIKVGTCLITLTALLRFSYGLRCIKCFKAPHLAHCEDTVNCNDTQICYVEQRVVFGQTLVFAGCKERTECDGEGCFGEESTSGATRWSKGRELKCHHCCDSDFCNMYGCPDTFGVNQLKGSRCFTCEQIQRPEVCENITNCGSTEVCIMEKFATGYEIYYRLACERKSMCTELIKVKAELRNSTAIRRKRQAVKFYSQCCTSHLCNRQDPILDEPPSSLSQNYQCRALPPLTTSTTQSTSTQTTPTTIKTTPTTTTTTESAKVVPIHGNDCRDKSVCSLYPAETACSLKWRDWARETCPRMCNLCSGSDFLKRTEGSTTQVSTTTADCRDQIDCTVYSKDYVCRGQFIPWAKYNCPVYCGLCPDIATTSTPRTASLQPRKDISCEDRIDCTVYGRDYACGEEFKQWAIFNCPNYCGWCSDTSNLPSSTIGSHKATAVTLPTTTTVPTSKLSTTLFDTTCIVDRIDCSIYGKDYACSEEFSEWAHYNCPRFCGFCMGPTNTTESVSHTEETTTETGGCRDKIDCSIYGKDYACSDEFTDWATENCPKYCNKCQKGARKSATVNHPLVTSSTGSSSECIDRTDCGVYGHDYICTDEFKPWATANCPLYCGYC